MLLMLRISENEILRLRTKASLDLETDLAALRRQLEDERAAKVRAVMDEIERENQQSVQAAR
jgi:hypothetical protein